jgi:hypothetical protein
MRLFCARITFRSGDNGAGLLVYELGAFSRARAAINAAASSMRFEVFDRVTGLPGAPGLSGSGGGALSGSELSHLCKDVSHSYCRYDYEERTWALQKICPILRKNVDA